MIILCTQFKSDLNLMEEEAQLKLLEDPKQCCWWWWVQTRLRRWVCCPHCELSSLKIETCTWCLLSSVLFFIIWGEVLAINSFSHTLKNPLQSLVVIYFGFFSFIFFLHFRSANDRRHFFFVFRFYQHFLKGNNNNNFYIISSLIWMHMILKLESEGSTTVGLFLLLVTVPGAKLK